MSAILKEASLAQHQATHLTSSVWVSASAGTGKTYVLTNRILKLLLLQPYLKPSEILAVTYTKAAAREMENRIRSRLSEWVSLSDEALFKSLEMVLGEVPTPDQCVRARGLLLEVLEDGKGLNISTIHGFCQQILGAFPLESGVPVGFGLLEGQEESDLIRQVQDEVFSTFEKGDVPPEQQWCFNYLAEDIHESTLRDVFQDIVFNRRKFNKLFQRHGTVENVLNALAKALDIMPESWTPESVLEDMESYFSVPSELVDYAKSFADSKTKKMQTLGAEVLFFHNIQEEEKGPCWPRYARAFLTKDGSFRKSLVDAATKKSANGALIEQAFNQEQERVYKVEQLRKSYRSWLLTAAYLHIGYEMIQAYGESKQQQNVLDFDDLIQKTAELFLHQERQMWVRYKMDRKIAHVMLDESQDMDDEQWEIIRALIQEFYDGSGQKEITRTLFAVGDTKQSIYRFRGAQPYVFGDIRTYLEMQSDSNACEARNVSLKTSFRSSKTILDFVDRVFEAEEKQQALDDTQQVQHQAVRQEAPGWVEVWPLCKEEEQEEATIENWPLPIQQPEKTMSARRLVARKMAQAMKELVENKTLLSSTQKPASYGDMMVLLRGRTMMPEIIEALDELNIPHAGSDRIQLMQDVMVDDMLAWLKFLHTREDDLSLAQVLKSPVFNLSEEMLMTLSLARRKASLWSVLNGEMKQQLQEIITTISGLSVYEMVVFIINKTNFYNKYINASHEDVNSLHSFTEAMDNLLESALKYGSQNGGIAGFIYKIEAGEIELKKGLESAGKNVRILTAHGSKGLEAPIVFMPDTTQDYYRKMSRDYLLWQEDKTDVNLFLYRQGKGQTPQLQDELHEAEKQRIFEDEMRLLYVALTRAQERLYIGGAAVQGRLPENCWYAEIEKITEQLADFGDAKVLYHAPHQPIVEKETNTEEHRKLQVQSWIAMLPAKEETANTIRPAVKEIGEDVLTSDQKKLYQRGRLMHRLLELLPRSPEEERQQTATAWLDKMLPEDATLMKEKMVRDVMGVFAMYPEFFTENSKPEVSFITTVNGSKVEGRIDRLVVTDNTVTIVDYKTDQIIPNDMPESYAQQLKLYKQAMQKVFPEKEVEACIVWVCAETRVDKIA